MRLITWNIQSCRGCDGVVAPRRIVETARALGDFDVFCLQEVAANFPALSGSSGEDQFAELAALLPDYSLAIGIGVDTMAPDGSRRRFGNAIFSRLPLLQVLSTRLPRPSDPQARRGMHRNLLEAVVATAFGPIRVMTTHLEFFSSRQRLAQVDAVLARHAEACRRAGDGQLVDESEGPCHSWPEPADALLVGDFNITPSDPLYQRLRSQPDLQARPFVDTWTHLHPDAERPPTMGVYDRSFVAEPIACDFIFATPGLLPRVRRLAVDGRTDASDHQPMLIELSTS